MSSRKIKSPQELRRTINKNMKTLEIGVTKLAKEVRMSPKTLSLWLQGCGYIPYEKLLYICDTLDIRFRNFRRLLKDVEGKQGFEDLPFKMIDK